LQEAVEDAGVKPLDDPNEDDKGRMGVTDLGETYCVPSESDLSATALERACSLRKNQRISFASAFADYLLSSPPCLAQ
jgi:hypothetical protein